MKRQPGTYQMMNPGPHAHQMNAISRVSQGGLRTQQKMLSKKEIALALDRRDMYQRISMDRIMQPDTRS